MLLLPPPPVCTQFTSNLPLGHRNEMFVWQFWHGTPLYEGHQLPLVRWTVKCLARLPLLMRKRLLPRLTSAPDKTPLFEPDFPALQVQCIATVRHLTLRNDLEKRRELFCCSLFPGLFLSYVMNIGLRNAIAWFFSELR